MRGHFPEIVTATLSLKDTLARNYRNLHAIHVKGFLLG